MPQFYETDEELAALKEIRESSVRAGVILMTSILEDALKSTLESRFKQDRHVTESLLGPERPLGNLMPRVNLCYLLGVYDLKMKEALQGIGMIRNVFAHQFGISNFTIKNKDLDKGFAKLVLHENFTHYPGFPDLSELEVPEIKVPKPKNRNDIFYSNFRIIRNHLLFDRLRHYPNSNIPTSKLKLRAAYQKMLASSGEAKSLHKLFGSMDAP